MSQDNRYTIFWLYSQSLKITKTISETRVTGHLTRQIDRIKLFSRHKRNCVKSILLEVVSLNSLCKKKRRIWESPAWKATARYVLVQLSQCSREYSIGLVCRSIASS